MIWEVGYPENTEKCCGSLHRRYVLRIHIVRRTRGLKGPNSNDNPCHKPDFWRGKSANFYFIQVTKKGWKTWFSVYAGHKPLKKPFLDRFWCSLDLCPLILGQETRIWWKKWEKFFVCIANWSWKLAILAVFALFCHSISVGVSGKNPVFSSESGFPSWN